MENHVEWIGALAALLTTLSFVPQAYQVYHTRKTHDLSLGMFTLFALGVALWLVYGIFHRSVPIMAANFITLLLASYILLMKLRYG
jgi:MtN3 and saliva related transmembrane protein